MKSNKYYINNAGDIDKDFEILSMHVNPAKQKNKNITSLFQSRTTDDTGTFKFSNYKIWDHCKNTNYISKIHDGLKEKYTTTTEFYNAKIVHDIMYNENNEIVSVFKDYLIMDDLTEFLKRSYVKEDWELRLPKIFKFYDSYSSPHPNYAVLPENKYLFRNFTK